MTATDSPYEAPVAARQLAALVVTVIVAGIIGTWSFVWPRAFFDRFPVVVGTWISSDGPYNEHLMRDHGAMWLALGAASLYGLARPSPTLCRALGIAWTVFAVLHAGYHLGHLGHLAPGDAVGLTVALVIAVGLGITLLAPPPSHRHPSRSRRRGRARGANRPDREW